MGTSCVLGAGPSINDVTRNIFYSSIEVRNIRVEREGIRISNVARDIIGMSYVETTRRATVSKLGLSSVFPLWGLSSQQCFWAGATKEKSLQC